MSTIYTPATIWKNFQIDAEPSFISGGRTTKGEFIYENGYIEGRYVDGVRIKIFVRTVKTDKNKMPAVIVLNDFSIESDDNLLESLASNGYFAVMVDVVGKGENRENFTVYPEKIGYANLENSSYGVKEINGDITKTCYYEWCGALKYVTTYLKSLKSVSKIGLLGINDGALSAWHLLATEQDINCAVLVNNTGWSVYEGRSKFLAVAEEGYSDGKVAYSAGIEPQSYASHVKCPTLILACTNSDRYDIDRAHDTLARIDDNLYKAINYSVNRTLTIEKCVYQDAVIFFEKFLSGKSYALPQDIEIKPLEGEELKVVANIDERGLKEVSLYISEGVIEPEKRSYQKQNDYLVNGGEYEFKINCDSQEGFICGFIKAEYKNGFEICSRVFGKVLENKRAKTGKINNIVYSSRLPLAESQFTSANEKNINSVIDVLGEAQVEVKKGPFDMLGITGKGGISTFNVCKDKIGRDCNCVFMFDAYLKNSGLIYVKLITDYFGEKTEYVSSVNIVGENIWQNVKIAINKFKTESGLTLKTYEKVDVIEFFSEEEYLVNNALWI